MFIVTADKKNKLHATCEVRLHTSTVIASTHPFMAYITDTGNCRRMGPESGCCYKWFVLSSICPEKSSWHTLICRTNRAECCRPPRSRLLLHLQLRQLRSRLKWWRRNLSRRLVCVLCLLCARCCAVLSFLFFSLFCFVLFRFCLGFV